MWLVALPAELITRRLYRAVLFYMPCYVMIIDICGFFFSLRLSISDRLYSSCCLYSM